MEGGKPPRAGPREERENGAQRRDREERRQMVVWSSGSGSKGGKEEGGAGIGEQAVGQSHPRGGEGGGGGRQDPAGKEAERKRVRESWGRRWGWGGEEEDQGATGPYLLCHLPHGLHAGSVQMAVVLAGLNELVRLNVLLHFLPGRHKMVIPAVHLVLPLGPCCVCQEVTPPPRSNLRLSSL